MDRKAKSIICFLHKHIIVLLVLTLFIAVGTISSNAQLQNEKLKAESTRIDYEGSHVSKQNAVDIQLIKKELVDLKVMAEMNKLDNEMIKGEIQRILALLETTNKN